MTNNVLMIKNDKYCDEVELNNIKCNLIFIYYKWIHYILFLQQLFNNLLTLVLSYLKGNN